jgi:hypothetical protein
MISFKLNKRGPYTASRRKRQHLEFSCLFTADPRVISYPSHHKTGGMVRQECLVSPGEKWSSTGGKQIIMKPLRITR